MKSKIINSVLLVVLLGMGGCTDPDSALKALKDQGYDEIKITGYEFGACGRDDSYSTGFEAKSLSGKKVKGVVCSGLFKGSTIRTF